MIQAIITLRDHGLVVVSNQPAPEGTNVHIETKRDGTLK